MKTTTGLTITINGQEPKLSSEGRIEVISDKLLNDEILNQTINNEK